MIDDKNLAEPSSEDLEALKTAQADWDALGDEAVSDDFDAVESLDEELDADTDEEIDVIGEDDDNPYQESDDILLDDEEEAALGRQLLPPE